LVPPETLRFVALRPEDASMSYHFRYGDELLLSHADTRKCLHLSEEVESPVSKNMEVSLCDESERCCSEDVWLVERADNSQDDYWRVG
jgi:dolichyl-phosphate-mannose--protein O-mannosyl transferase